jgi:biopolymer transport protein ExbB/TolQ
MGLRRSEFDFEGFGRGKCRRPSERDILLRPDKELLINFISSKQLEQKLNLGNTTEQACLRADAFRAIQLQYQQRVEQADREYQQRVEQADREHQQRLIQARAEYAQGMVQASADLRMPAENSISVIPRYSPKSSRNKIIGREP